MFSEDTHYTIIILGVVGTTEADPGVIRIYQKDNEANAALVDVYQVATYTNDILVTIKQADEVNRTIVVDAFDPQEAAREMVRTKAMGSVGVMVLGEYNEKGLDHEDFAPLWETAQDIGMPINVHPGTGALAAWEAFPSVAHDQFLMSVVRGFKTICSSGLLDRYPGVNVSFLETGCTWVDFAIEVMDFRLDNIRHRIQLDALRSEHKPIIERGLPKMTPMEYIKAGRIFIGFEVDDDLLPYMVNKYGTDCWVYASDIPHAHRKPDSPKFVLNRTDLPDTAKEKILWHGTARLYGLDLPEGKNAAA